MGANINYDADFDICKNEIGKIGNIDYALVESSCRKLLADKSKDMRLLCFLSFVYLRDAKWESFADVFDGFVKLAQQNFDAMFPDRERAKQNAIKWLAEPRYNETLAAQKPAEADYAHISRLLAALTALKPVLQEKFPEGSPFPSALFSSVQNWEKACKPKPKADVAPGAPAGQTVGDPMDTPKQAQTIARKAAGFLIEKEPQRPMGFRLMRSLRWDIFEKAPPSEGGKTQLAPPPADLVASLNASLNNKEFKPALDKAETAFTAAANHLWLGLQRIAALAAQGLGEPYKPVEQAILFETGLFVRRFPDIMKLSFSDGSPFCDDATRDWIAASVMPMFSAEGGAAAPKKDADESCGDKVEDDKKKVASLTATGKTEAALDLLQNAIRNSSNERDNFRRSILVCNLLVTAKQPDIALSILDSLDAKIQLYHLDKWDPDLAVDAWGIMVKVLKVARASKTPPVQASMAEKQNSILSKISQIDPKKAFSLNT
jgi:type VI secretion system protein VasJ